MNKRKKYDRRDIFSVHINVDTDDKTLEWINNQRHLSKVTLDILEQYANGELIHIDAVKQMIEIGKNNSNIAKSEDKEEYPEFKPTSEKKLIDIPEEEWLLWPPIIMYICLIGGP